MLPKINHIKGVHPGAVIKRELKKRSIKSVSLATAIDEYPQTLNAIEKGKRGINPKLSIKLGKYFSVDPDYFMILQACYEVKEARTNNEFHPFLSQIRSILFWDTKLENLDIEKNKRYIIQRVFERGNELEINSLIEFYGDIVIRQVLKTIKDSFHPAFRKNVAKHLTIDVGDIA